MVEGTRLESVRTLKRTAGSNPALSAIKRHPVRVSFFSRSAGENMKAAGLECAPYEP